MPLPELTLQARYVFPVDGPPVERGCVRVAGERITYVGPADRTPDLDFGNAAILPGFVNTHTHLELSGVRAKDVAASDFTGWLRRIIEARRGQNPVTVAHAVQRGVDASLAAGTTLLGDISTAGRSWKELQRSPLRATVFCELLGLNWDRAIETAGSARQFLTWAGAAGSAAQQGTEDESIVGVSSGDTPAIKPLPKILAIEPSRRLTPSVSPHAPYSTHEFLYSIAAYWSRRAAVPLCTHLAETKEELRLLEHRDGPLREFLASIGAWDDSWKPVGLMPTDYSERVVDADADWILAHGNYLTEAEIVRLTRRTGPDSPRRSIVYCPRTHAYFGHSRHPYSRMLAAGLTVCLGTDSLASTPNLSILDEMRFLHRRDDSLPTATILHMATLSGATALRRESVCGSLTAGKFADLAVVRLPDREDEDAHRLLLQSDQPVIRTIIGGRFVFQMR